MPHDCHLLPYSLSQMNQTECKSLIYQVDQQLDGDEPDEVPDGEEGVVGPGAGHRVVGVFVVGDVRGRRRRPPPAALATCGELVQSLLLPLVPLAAG